MCGAGDGGHTVGPVKANWEIRARICAAGKVLEGNDGQILSELYKDCIEHGSLLYFIVTRMNDFYCCYC